MPETTSSNQLRPIFIGAMLTVLAATAVGCNRGSMRMDIPEIRTRADSLALAVLDANGGRDAWESMRYLRFTFGTEDASGRNEVAWHLWDRARNSYRLEWVQGDSLVVAVFNIDSRNGDVYVDGVAAEAEAERELLETAYRRFINDTYWLMAPVKMLEPGVNREYVADSSNTEVDVVRLTFDDVGLTPGDTFWMYIDRNTDVVVRWAYVLQGNPNAPPTFWNWREYRDFEVPGGVVRFGTRKERPDGSSTLVTDEIEVPSTIADTMFTSPHPILRSGQN